MTPSSLATISYGGGVQSTALIVLAVRGDIQASCALFANVGDDSEHPATLRYVREVMTPWAAEHGFPVHELSRNETLMARLRRRDRSIDIPMRMANGAPGNRTCTADFKMRVVGKWLRAHGASKASPATVHIGISWDEMHRMGNKRVARYEVVSYPLIDRRLTREDCKRVIEAAGLPVPPKSACFFCPYKRPAEWARMRRDEPELFNEAAILEAMLNVRRSHMGKDRVWLTRFAVPLREAIHEAQPELPLGGLDGGCDDGYCWT